MSERIGAAREFFEIGCTINLRNRYKARNITRKEVVTVIPIPSGMNKFHAEKFIHSLFAHRRVGRFGEKFMLTPEDIEELKRIDLKTAIAD